MAELNVVRTCASNADLSKLTEEPVAQGHTPCHVAEELHVDTGLERQDTARDAVQRLTESPRLT